MEGINQLSPVNRSMIKEYVKKHEMGSDMAQKIKSKTKPIEIKSYKPKSIISNSTFGVVYKAEQTLINKE